MEQQPQPGRNRKRRGRRPPSFKQIVHSPHDALFQYAISFPDTACELLELLPEHIRPRIDPASVRAVDRHFIDQRLRHRFSDCLLEATLREGQPAFIYYLVEHLRQAETWMPLRILQYTVAIWEAYLREHPDAEKLPLVIPILIYNGEGDYPKTLDLSALIDAPIKLIEEFFLRPAKLIALGTIEDERVAQMANLGATLMAMKHVDDEMPTEKIFRLLARIKDTRRRMDLAEALSYYIISVANVDPRRLVETATTHLGKRFGGTIMTTAERLLNEGMELGRLKGHEEGREEGVEIGLVKTALTMFKKGMDLEMVSEFIALPLERLKGLQRQVSP